MISIIIPVYNAERYLNKCIQSVVEQSYFDWELLLVDDGSKDNSGQICDDYAKTDKRIKVIHRQNGGVSAARNIGLENVTGEWITFMDSDDWLDVDTLFIYNEAILHFDVDIIKTGYRLHKKNSWEEKTVLCEKIFEDTSDLFVELQKTKYYAFVWNTLIKADIAKQCRFDEKTSWLEDQFFVYDCFLKAQRVLILPQITYNYIVHDVGSLSSVNDPFVIAYSANKDILYKQKLLGCKNNSVYVECCNTFHLWMTKAINELYAGNFDYSQRKKFYFTYSNIIGKCHTSEENQFFNVYMPFIIIDILFRLKKIIH